MNPLKVVAYATNKAYRGELERLKASLSEQMVDHYEHVTESEWTWAQAVSWKPTFILECLDRFPGHDLLYTDADSILRRPMPKEDLEECDFACHKFQRSRHHAIEYLTGTAYFRNTSDVWTFVNDWAAITPQFVTTPCPEQESLKVALSKHRKLVWKDLAPEWCYVFDDFKKIYPGRAPIYEHFQASRRLRK